MLWTHSQWVRNTMNFEMDFEFWNEQFWCFTMDFSTHSVLFRNEDKFKIQQSCYFEIDVWINSESFRNGVIFEIINEILKQVFCTALRLQLANWKWWAFLNQNFCFRIEIFELQKVNSKFAQFRNEFFFSFQNEVFEMFLYTVNHFEIR